MQPATPRGRHTALSKSVSTPTHLDQTGLDTTPRESFLIARSNDSLKEDEGENVAPASTSPTAAAAATAASSSSSKKPVLHRGFSTSAVTAAPAAPATAAAAAPTVRKFPTNVAAGQRGLMEKFLASRGRMSGQSAFSSASASGNHVQPNGGVHFTPGSSAGDSVGAIHPIAPNTVAVNNNNNNKAALVRSIVPPLDPAAIHLIANKQPQEVIKFQCRS